MYWCAKYLDTYPTLPPLSIKYIFETDLSQFILSPIKEDNLFKYYKFALHFSSSVRILVSND